MHMSRADTLVKRSGPWKLGDHVLPQSSQCPSGQSLGDHLSCHANIDVDSHRVGDSSSPTPASWAETDEEWLPGDQEEGGEWGLDPLELDGAALNSLAPAGHDFISDLLHPPGLPSVEPDTRPSACF